MMPWFMRDPERLKLERKGIEELSRTASWLVGTEWRIGEDGLGLDAVICAKGHDYELRISFPTLYPDVPIIVRPQNMQSRISSHQYGGADGPLCLEWGPDNWHRDVTSVQMLESTYRLLEIEDPLGEDRHEIPMIAPSRHKLTIGQDLRGKWIRWFAGKTLYGYFADRPSHLSVGTFKFSLRQTGEIWIIIVHEATPFGGSVWRNEHIPAKLLEEAELKTGIWLKTDLDKKTIGHPKKLMDLRDLFLGMEEAKFLSTDESSPVDVFGKLLSGVLIFDQDEEFHLFIVFPDEDVLECSRVRSDDEPMQTRSPESDGPDCKCIGLVGLGSVGSKIAISFARMGCRKFYLIDHDLLLPENLQRHALDWQGVAQHKVDAMKTAIDLVAPGTQVDISRLHITGQESNASINGALNQLTECDVIIDATADSKVFNLLAAVVRVSLRPLIWMEVYGGGLGGWLPGVAPRSIRRRRKCEAHISSTAQITLHQILGQRLSIMPLKTKKGR